MQQKLLAEFYDEIKIDPASLAYVEAHSTGTVVGDPEECQALDNIFCKNRDKPLPVGSVKSNIGHSESTAGACSIAKVLLAFETGLIAPNINFTKIRQGIPSLEEGRLSVCTDITKLDGDLVGLNAFGFGGANGKHTKILAFITMKLILFISKLSFKCLHNLPLLLIKLRVIDMRENFELLLNRFSARFTSSSYEGEEKQWTTR